jgi:polysaccharide transporter, PST family
MSQTNQVLRSSLNEGVVEETTGAAARSSSVGMISLARGSGIAIAGGLVSQALKAAVIILLARSFSTNQFGAFSFANSVNAFLFIISQFGLPVFGAREVAQYGGVPSGLLRAITEARLLLGLLGALLVVAVLFFSAGVTREEVWLVAGFGLSNVALSCLYDWVFQGAGKLHLWAVVNIAWQGLWLLFTIVGIHTRASIVMASFGYAAGAGVAALIGLPWLRRLRERYSASHKVPSYSMRHVLKAGANLGIGTLLITVLVWTDTIVVRLLRGQQAAGVYAAGNRISLALAMLASFYVLGAFPRLSRSAADSPADFSRYFQRAYEDLALLFIPGSLWAIVYAPRVMLILFGHKDYLAGVGVFRIFQIFLLVASFSNLYGMGALVANRRDRAYRRVLVISLGVMLVLCPILTVKWGIEGTAVAVLVGQAVSLALFAAKSGDVVHAEHLRTLALPLMIGMIPLVPGILFHLGFWSSAASLALVYLGIALWRHPLAAATAE